MQTVTDFLFGRDMLIAIVGAVLGGILLYLFGALPRWSSNLLTQLAKLSKKSAEMRANRLRLELQTIKELKNDLTRYVGVLVRYGVTTLVYLLVAILLLIFTVSYQASLTKLATGLYHGILFGTYNYSSYDITITLQQLSFILLFLSFYKGMWMRNYCNLKDYETRIQAQIDQLIPQGAVKVATGSPANSP
jgi:hypothetical protein